MAVLTANPNPVTVTIFSFSQQGQTTIAWDTQNAFDTGTLQASIDGGPFTQAKETGGAPVIARVNGSTKQNIAFGKKYVFRLQSGGSGNPILASVSVEAREVLGLPSGLVQLIQSRTPLLQGITNLRVFPLIDSVRIMFKTRQPTVPVVDVKRTSDQQVAGAAFPFFGGASTAHDLAFPLAQNTNFTFHILAAAAAGSSSKPAETSGQFRTGSRRATVFFDQIFMHTDGDPGSLGDGDFTIDMGAGDIETQDMLGATQFVDEISGGENRTVGQSVTIDPAPVGLWVQVKANEDDSFFTPFGYDPYVTFAPEGSTWETYEGDYGEDETATITKWFDLSGAGPVAQEIPFTLETGPRHIDFSFNCRLRMEAVPGANLQPMMTKSAKPIVRAKTVAMLGVGDRVAVAGRTTHVVLLAPDGGLYLANARDRGPGAAPPRDTRWTRVASELREPLTVVAAEDALQVLAIGTDGQVMHRSIAPDAVQPAPGHERWRSLGGRVVALAAATAGAAVELFALGAEGAVSHRSLGSESAGEWRSIGEGMTGSLKAFTTARGDIGLVALGRGGDVRYLRWSAKQAPGGSPDWRSLGKAPAGVLSAEWIDDVVVLAVLGEDESVHAAPWRDFPEPPAKLEWQTLGTMSDLISSRYALMHRS